MDEKSAKRRCIGAARGCSAAALLAVALSAHAGIPPDPGAVPEPGTWALVGLAAVIGAIVTRNRRK